MVCNLRKTCWVQRCVDGSNLYLLVEIVHRAVCCSKNLEPGPKPEVPQPGPPSGGSLEKSLWLTSSHLFFMAQPLECWCNSCELLMIFQAPDEEAPFNPNEEVKV